MAIDDGTAISYTALPTGVPVYSSDEIVVGTVREVLDNARERIFDGIVFENEAGGRVFVDAPEVARTAERGVTLTLTAAQAAELPPHKGGGPLGKLFRR
ncbi:MAG TPA: hypothetical protein VEW67_07780 [Thermoleophilaceae bacterium]|nr:hypothetical protein [Thermoleophilaceae bacterium]